MCSSDLSSIFRVHGLKAHSIVLEPKNPDAITPHALFLTYHPSQGGKPLDPEVYPRPTGIDYFHYFDIENTFIAFKKLLFEHSW